KQKYFIVSNLSFIGSNINSIQAGNASFISIQYCTFDQTGTDAIDFHGGCNHMTVQHCRFNHSQSSAITLYNQTSDHFYLGYDSIFNSGIIGMGNQIPPQYQG